MNSVDTIKLPTSNITPSIFDNLPSTFEEQLTSCGNCGCYLHIGSCYGLYNIGGSVQACDCRQSTRTKISFIITIDEFTLNMGQEKPSG